MTKYIIINADDFGLSPSVNRGIIESYLAGTVSSTTLMTNMPGFDDAVALAKKYPSLGVGLHFNLSYGRPLSNPQHVVSLVDENGDYAYRSDDTDVFWTEADIRTELEAQWRKFVSSGLVPTHMDSHHLVHKLRPVYQVVVDFCQEHNLPLRLTEPNPAPEAVHPTTTDALVGDEYFHGDGKDRILRHLNEISKGVTELFCHPGYVDEHVRAISPWTDVREKELTVFTDPDVANAIRDAGIVRSTYGVLDSIRSTF